MAGWIMDQYELVLRRTIEAEKKKEPERGERGV
jgi:hypothetical protein